MFRAVDAELLDQRLKVVVPVALARMLKPRERFLSGVYRRKIALLCINTSYRVACEVFNEMSLRKERNEEMSLSTLIRDFQEEGQHVREAKKALCLKILAENNINPDTLSYKGEAWPEEWQEPKDCFLTVTGNDPLPSLIDDWNPSNPQMPGPDIEVGEEEPKCGEKEEKERVKKIYSEPDTDTFVPKRRRRTTRYEIAPEDMAWACNGYVDWLNAHIKHDQCKILQPWVLEKDPSRVVYISIDAVFVDQQCEKHVKGGKPEMKLKKDRISHWNTAIEFDNLRYCITAATRFEAMQQLLAVLLANQLMDRHFVFFADGEVEIFDDVKSYFGWRVNTLILDWYHVVEKVFQRLSMAIFHTRVTDPRAPVENYKQKSRQDEEKTKKETSLSVLYARRVCSILWAGNVEEAIKYLDNIDPKVIKNKEQIDKLIDYLNRKKEWIVCYALRKRAGLRNSSNGSEGANNELVAQRQKDDDMSWRDEGSTSNSNMSCLFANHEETLWFCHHQVTYTVPDDVRQQAKAEQKRQVHGKIQ